MTKKISMELAVGVALYLLGVIFANIRPAKTISSRMADTNSILRTNY
jgi:hypothetical protein